MVDIQSPTAEIRRGKKKKEERKKDRVKYNGLPYSIGRIITTASATQGDHKAGLVRQTYNGVETESHHCFVDVRQVRVTFC